MRIDGLSNAPAGIRTNVADLLDRLDTGDVIKARVLEITSSEVVLRLFDGSVLKAATAEGLEAKVGQTLTLAVTSRSEGTLFLETVKDTIQLNSIKPDILKIMLEALQIKPDAKNMELAAEFTKAGISASAAQYDKAAGLMESFKGLNAEKAVFMASKGIQADQIKLELLTKLLDGDLKLGEQLKELQNALNSLGRTIGKNTANDALAAKASSASNTTAQALQQATALNGTAAEAQTSPVQVFNKTDSNPSALKEAVTELFVNINSDKLASDLDVKKLHIDLNTKLDMLKAVIQTSNLTGLTGSEGITATTTLLEDSIKLLNQLNSNSILYFQLPVNLSGYNTTAELYVMKRQQKKKRIDPHNTVMFVSLDTNNLGRVETLLDVKGKNVSINLRTEKQQINDFVKENIKHLYSGLANCGYKLVDIKYALIDSPAKPIKLEQLLTKMIDSNYSKVDMRI